MKNRIEYLRRIYRHTDEILHDANLLAQSTKTQSNADSWLKVLAMEILLKAAILYSSSAFPKTHCYRELWLKLPVSVSQQTLQFAKMRSPTFTDFSDINLLFDSWQSVFTKDRYYYEYYEDWSDEEVHELGELWLNQLGAPENEAEVRFFPEELFCLTNGLRRYLAEELGIQFQEI